MGCKRSNIGIGKGKIECNGQVAQRRQYRPQMRGSCKIITGWGDVGNCIALRRSAANTQGIPDFRAVPMRKE